MNRHAIRVATVLFVAIAALMHVLQPEFDPITSDISRHQAGPYGYVMSLGGLAFGVALLLAGFELRRRGRLGSVLLFGAAAGSAIAAIVPAPPPPVTSIRFLIHQGAGFLMFAGAIGGVTVGSGAFQPDSAARLPGKTAVWCARFAAGAGALFLLSIAVDATGRGSLHGLLQRVTLAAICGWLLAISVERRGAAAARPASPRSSAVP